MSAPRYDLAVIGSGPGGCAAALTAARRGLRVGVIEREQWGGVCLNVGCIPTKALVAVSTLLRRLRRAAALGVTIHGSAVDYDAVRARNERIVTTLRRGLTEVLQREQVALIPGRAVFEGPQTLAVTEARGTQRVDADRIVIACGARPLSGPWEIDERRILSYRGVLALPRVPRSLLIIGGGVIGCEFASCLASFGTQVTVVEQQPQLLPMDDQEAVRWLTRRFEADGITVLTGRTVQQLERADDGVAALLSDGTRCAADYGLVAIGQRPQVEGLQLAAAGVAHGRGVTVDAQLRTSQPHIGAIGDCVEGHGLAHWASAEGALVVRNWLGDPPAVLNPLDIPRCIFTDPEIAHVGPVAARDEGALQASRFSFGALGKSHCDEETEGFVKLLVDPATEQLRGATIVGAHASTLIHHAVLAIHQGMTARQLARVITAHPTLPEAVSEAAAHLYGESLMLSARGARRGSMRVP